MPMTVEFRQVFFVIRMRVGSARDMPGQLQVQQHTYAQKDIRLSV